MGPMYIKTPCTIAITSTISICYIYDVLVTVTLDFLFGIEFKYTL